MTSFFPSATITWYMARMFFTRIIAVLLALALVLQTLDLLGASGDILAYKGNGGEQLWYYVSLRLPQIIAFLLPFSVLLATLITLATMNQNSEVVSMKAGGLSAHQVLAPLILSSLIIAAVSFAFSDRIVSRASSTLDRWEKVEYGPLPRDLAIQTNVWVRDGHNLVHADQVRGRGRDIVLTGVTVYNREKDTLLEVVKAPRVAYTGTGWMLRGATRFDVATGRQSPLPDGEVGKDVRPDQFTLANVDSEGLSFLGLRAAIADLDMAGRPTGSLKADMWHKLSGPLSSVLMPLLGAVAAFGLARSGQLFVRAVIGMGLGFAFFVADNFGLAMGNLGAYPPWLAAWGPFALFLLIGETVLIRTEE